jgi:hypothetical protein
MLMQGLLLDCLPRNIHYEHFQTFHLNSLNSDTVARAIPPAWLLGYSSVAVNPFLGQATETLA